MPSIFSGGTSLPSTISNEPDRLIVDRARLLWGKLGMVAENPLESRRSRPDAGAPLENHVAYRALD